MSHIDKIKTDISELSRQCAIMERAGASFGVPEIRGAHDRIIQILDYYSTTYTLNDFLRIPGVPRLRERLLEANVKVHMRSEVESAAVAISKDGDPFDSSWINPGFYELLLGQVERWRLLGIPKSGDRRPLVIVGGGALPQSQVLLHRQTGRAIISLDKDAESVYAARRVIRHLGYSSKLKVVQQDGMLYDYGEASLVVIAGLVLCKYEIAARVFHTAPSIFLNVRTPTGVHGMWRVPVDPDGLRSIGWNIVDTWTPQNSAISSLTCINA